MIEVTKEQFHKIVSKIPYKTFFILGQEGVRYEGSQKKFKNYLFAKQVNGKYYVLELLINQLKYQ